MGTWIIQACADSPSLKNIHMDYLFFLSYYPLIITPWGGGPYPIRVPIPINALCSAIG